MLQAADAYVQIHDLGGVDFLNSKYLIYSVSCFYDLNLINTIIDGISAVAIQYGIKEISNDIKSTNMLEIIIIGINQKWFIPLKTQKNEDTMDRMGHKKNMNENV